MTTDVPGSQVAGSLFSATPSAIAAFSAANEVVLRINVDGSVDWRGRRIEGDDDFKAAVIDLAATLSRQIGSDRGLLAQAQQELDVTRDAWTQAVKASDLVRAEVEAAHAACDEAGCPDGDGEGNVLSVAARVRALAGDLAVAKATADLHLAASGNQSVIADRLTRTIVGLRAEVARLKTPPPPHDGGVFARAYILLNASGAFQTADDLSRAVAAVDRDLADIRDQLTALRKVAGLPIDDDQLAASRIALRHVVTAARCVVEAMDSGDRLPMELTALRVAVGRLSIPVPDAKPGQAPGPIPTAVPCGGSPRSP